MILGTCHAGMADPFAVTLKPYETPLGPVPVDRDFYEALDRRAGQDLLASEPAHRAEHSIEFQAVMLQHLVGGRRPFAILPVLASYLHEALWARRRSRGATRACRASSTRCGRRWRRPRAGCAWSRAWTWPTWARASAIREPNSAASLARGRARGSRHARVGGGGRRRAASSRRVAADRDARRICGLSPIYTLLRLLPAAPGRLCATASGRIPQGAVTFCAVAFP